MLINIISSIGTCDLVSKIKLVDFLELCAIERYSTAESTFTLTDKPAYIVTSIERSPALSSHLLGPLNHRSLKFGP